MPTFSFMEYEIRDEKGVSKNRETETVSYSNNHNLPTGKVKFALCYPTSRNEEYEVADYLKKKTITLP